MKGKVEIIASWSFNWWFSVFVQLVRHPELWVIATKQALKMLPRNWWKRKPFLPIPDTKYIAFRVSTMYGNSGNQIDPEDLLEYLRWCKSWKSHG